MAEEGRVAGESMQRRRTPSAASLRAWLAACLVVVGALRIIATYEELSETVDEVAHVGAGMEWLALGKFTLEVRHPPLARVAAAMGPYLLGVRSQHQVNVWDEGRRVLYADNAYLRNLTAARLGILPFFFLAAFFTWRLGRVAFGSSAALGAVACLTLLPPVLAHFGVATTDAPMFAMFIAAMYALTLWFEVPNVKRGAGAGAASALAFVSKLSAIPYVGATVMLIGAARIWAGRRSAPSTRDVSGDATVVSTTPWPWRKAIISALVAALAGFLVAWAMYRFTIGTIRGIPVPLAEIPQGIKSVTEHNRVGHPAYFLGNVHVFGVWYFFPVMLALKTPISALLLGALGSLLLVRRALRHREWVPLVPIAVMVGVLGIAVTSDITIGVRHVLPFYLGLSLAVGVAWDWAWTRLRRRGARVALIAATTLLSVRTLTIHPDYLAYFNEFAGRDPSRLVADSDLDWGQDMFRLRRELEARGVDTLRFAYIGTADISPIVGVPVKFWDGNGRPSGWVAVAETWYRRGQIYERRGRYVVEPNAMHWLDTAGTLTRVGKGIRLYQIPAVSRPSQ